VWTASSRGLDARPPVAYHLAMPTPIAGHPPDTGPRPRVDAAAAGAEVAAIRAELLRYAWGVREGVYIDATGRPVYLLEGRWSETRSRVRAESRDRASAWREILRKAHRMGLLGPESRPPGRRPRRPGRGPRVISFTDLGYDPSR
jgi:hypothetical protein